MNTQHNREKMLGPSTVAYEGIVGVSSKRILIELCRGTDRHTEK